jgi:ABC-type amino acid transport substrate-binding protein
MNLPLRFALIAALLASAASCGIPKDSRGTLDRVRSARQIRVGLILASPDPALDAESRALLTRLSAATGALPRIVPGDAEPLLTRLEEGELDIVFGRFSAKSPWSTLVTLSPALATARQGKTDILTSAAMQNGENAWIALVEREARALPGTAR